MAAPKRPLFLDSPPENSSPVYLGLLKPANGRAALVRAQCEELWRDFQDLADENFTSHLPLDFPRRWFEMYLGAALRRTGLDVSAPKPGPDFRVLVNRRPAYIEAIAPTPGRADTPDSVPQPVYKDEHGNPMASRVPHDLITLRLTGALAKKTQIFRSYVAKGYIENEAPRIIAINLSDIPHAWADAEEFWFRALYGVGDRFVAIDRSGGAAIEGRHHRSLLHRGNGAPVDVAALLNPERADISGVLGSSVDFANLPGPLGDDFLLMPHAAAACPYPPGFLRRGAEVRLAAGDGGRWNVDTVDYSAHEPRGPENFAIDFEGAKFDGEWAVAGRTLCVAVDKHRCDVLIKGSDDPAASALAIAREMLLAYRGRVSSGEPREPRDEE